MKLKKSKPICKTRKVSLINKSVEFFLQRHLSVLKKFFTEIPERFS